MFSNTNRMEYCRDQVQLPSTALTNYCYYTVGQKKRAILFSIMTVVFLVNFCLLFGQLEMETEMNTLQSFKVTYLMA